MPFPTGRPAHTALNQAPPLVDYDMFASDAALVEGVTRHGAGWAAEPLGVLGRRAGGAEAQEWGRLANVHPPVLHTHDRYGTRVDEVEFHPAWHALLAVAVGAGLHAAPWAQPRPGAHVARAAGFHLWNQVESGHLCPVSMTHAAVPVLRAAPEIAAVWEPRVTAYCYDFGLRPAGEKAGCLVGMGMTEKQGGSDVRTNTTAARPSPDGTYLLSGHKWFTSAPMSDAFLMLAQAPGGLTCFLVPRVLDDGTRNRIRLQRLKDKLGNRSNASSEPDLEDAVGFRVGDEGRGVRTIIEMVALTRLDCVTGSASHLRQAVAQATHHAAYRHAFGARLADHAAMRSVLADLAVEAEAATALALRLAAAVDAGETAFTRLALPAAKFLVCKRAPVAVGEALECLGGNGYVEEFPLARLYREAPLNSLWEGSGNVNALDVLRALRREPAAAEAVLAEASLAAGADRRLDAAWRRLRARLASPLGEADARRIAEEVALTLQGALLVRHGHPAVADAFCATRLADGGGVTFGTLPPEVAPAAAAIVERATPKVG